MNNVKCNKRCYQNTKVEKAEEEAVIKGWLLFFAQHVHMEFYGVVTPPQLTWATTKLETSSQLCK